MTRTPLPSKKLTKMERLGNIGIGAIGSTSAIGLGQINHILGIIAGTATIIYMVIATGNELAKRNNRKK